MLLVLGCFLRGAELYWHSTPAWIQVAHGFSPEHFRLRDWHDRQAARERLRGVTVESAMVVAEMLRGFGESQIRRARGKSMLFLNSATLSLQQTNADVLPIALHSEDVTRD